MRVTVQKALDAFVNDPADSEHQRGYLAALLELMPDHPHAQKLRLQLSSPDLIYAREAVASVMDKVKNTTTVWCLTLKNGTDSKDYTARQLAKRIRAGEMDDTADVQSVLDAIAWARRTSK